MAKNRIGVLVLAAALGVGATGGGWGSAAAQTETYTVGFLGSLTGFLAPFDDPVYKGVQAAVEDLNARGGIDNKYRIELQVVDSRSDPVQAQIAGEELMEKGAQFLIGPCSGDVGLPPAQIAQEKGIPFVSSCSGDSAFPMKVGSYGFLANPGALAQGAALAHYAHKMRGLKSAYVLTSKDLVYTNFIGEGFRQAYEKFGGSVLQVDHTKLWQPSYAAQVTKIRNMNPRPDVIMTSLFVPDSTVFLRELRAAGVDTPVLLDDGNDTLYLFAGGVKVGDVIVASMGYPSPGSSLEKFFNVYKAKFGSAPESNLAGVGGDIVALIVASVRAAETIDPKAVRDALDNLVDVEVPSATITYKGYRGLPKRDVYLIAPNAGQDGFDLVGQVWPDFVPSP